MEEVLDMVVGHEVYSFLDGFSNYHQITITSKYRYKIAFIIDWGTFVWIIMPFGLKNAPPTYQQVMSMAFREYLGVFMKLFLDDFNVFSNLKKYLAKLQLCFDKCREFNISLNMEKHMFLVYSRIILGYGVSKVGTLLDPNFVLTIVNMLALKMPKDVQVFNGMAQFYQCFMKNFCFHHGPHHETLMPNVGVCVDYQMLRSVGGHKTKVFGCTDLSCIHMGHGISHAHKCIKYNSQGYVGSKSLKKCDQPIAYTSRLLNNVEKNYTTTKREAFAMVYALHKFRHYLLGE